MKPKKLSIDEIWKLYLLLKPALDNREKKDILLDEVETLLQLSRPGTLFAVLSILYDNISKDMSGMEAVVALMKGLSDNDFYWFVDFIKKQVAVK